ncbi:hypothetical protein [Natronolimnohabitans innermongolicus]|uniref:Uncharacterized protein n=1 Tax=Natronolimnohabitans innermongolicus JCM 12255 TaxID=1227499 RepID=L9WYF7_9EURY|nr:hypothetical protein [Natronolimnohabitans innermongolicus]ELY54490.1 hypothetical protein C493_12534 [Natronolimnohabitans innermongolicus JCM 12255]
MDGDDAPFGAAATDGDGYPTKDELLDEIEDVRLSPSEHQRIKDLLNGDRMDRITGHDRRYLVAGAGGESGAVTRREIVYDRLDSRTDPPATAMQLEDFGLTPEEIRLWTRVFDILCGRATHIVAVIEDFDGGYVWELGLLFSPSYREKVWVLKRRYLDEKTEREQYANGMAASHVELLLTGDNAYEWADVDELRDGIDEIP